MSFGKSRITLLTYLLSAAFSILTGCGHTSVRWRGGPPAAPVTGPVFVLVLPGPALPPKTAGFDNRLLAIVRERDPAAEITQGSEASGSQSAATKGARYLLIATVREWRDARTQYSGEPDRIRINVRLMQLHPPALVREFEFDTRGTHIAVRDAPAGRLLGNKFHDAVRRLIAPAHP